MNDAKASNAAGPAVEAQDSGKATKKHGPDVRKLALGALGVVYGDIGTSPLYALKECVTMPHGVTPAVENIFGLLSLIFWSITLVVSVKYILYVMRADNNGEGGVLSLMALAARVGQSKSAVEEDTGDRGEDKGDKTKKPKRQNWHEVKRAKYVLIMLGLFGSALLYGDGVITPAISVLSAVEGLEVAT
ncbi:MAG TPA: KUP/HAK/KT family potassium transporter, partial [Polyangia bacterium]